MLSKKNYENHQDIKGNDASNRTQCRLWNVSEHANVTIITSRRHGGEGSFSLL
jgi:hypothetical protein